MSNEIVIVWAAGSFGAFGLNCFYTTGLQLQNVEFTLYFIFFLLLVGRVYINIVLRTKFLEGGGVV